MKYRSLFERADVIHEGEAALDAIMRDVKRFEVNTDMIGLSESLVNTIPDLIAEIQSVMVRQVLRV